MVLEMVGTLLTAISLIYTRLDRRSDKKMSPSSVRDGLLQLEDLLSRWIHAARRTMAAVTQGGLEVLTRPHSVLPWEAMQNYQVGWELDRWLDPEYDGTKETNSLRQLLDVYAPETAQTLRTVASARLELLEQGLAEEGLRQMRTEEDWQVWAEQLFESCKSLEAARDELRTFVTSNFPLSG